MGVKTECSFKLLIQSAILAQRNNSTKNENSVIYTPLRVFGDDILKNVGNQTFSGPH